MCVRVNKMNPIQTLEKIMETLTKNGYSYQVTRRDLEKAIIQVRGIDKRTIERWIQLLLIFEFIKKENEKVFDINITKINIVNILKKHPQTQIS